MTMDLNTDYRIQTLNDFHERKSGMQMYFELNPLRQKTLARHFLGEAFMDLPRELLRRAVMKKLSGPKGFEFFERIRLAYLAEAKQDDAGERE
jgi:hypothetical protein